MDISFLDSDAFLIGYYVLTVGASLLLIKDTKKRIRDLRVGIGSMKYAPIAYVDQIPILNWSWLGYNIAFGPFAEQGMLGIIPFVPLLLYMFLHINYFEEFYFRKSKKMVLVWALIHIGMGIKIHMALILIPIGFVFKYIYDKKGIKHSYAMHFATNIMVVVMLFASFVL